MSQEKIELLMNYLKADDARAEKLLDMDAQEAASVLAADGIAVTADELKAFGEEIAASAQASQTGELDESSLDGVSGGCGWYRFDPSFNYGYIVGRVAKKLTNW